MNQLKVVATNSVFSVRWWGSMFTVVGVASTVACSSAKLSRSERSVYNVGYGYYNSYLIVENDQLMLIDSGLPNKGEKLAKNITTLGFDPARVSHLVITHVHADHVGAAAWFQEKYGTQVIAHRNEQHLAEQGSFDSLHIVTPKRLLGKLAYQQVEWNFPAFTPDILVADSLNLRPYGFDATVRTVRGHTEGSVIVSYGNALFVGDLIRGGYVFGKHQPEYHFFAEDLARVLTMLDRLLKEPYTTWYVGHGGPLKSRDVKDFLSKDD